MRAGPLKYKLELWAPVESADIAFGGDTGEYEFVRVVNAERTKIRGNRSDEAGEHFPNLHVEFCIRDAHKVKPNWRVRQLGGDEYIVCGVIPDRDRGMLTLICDRLNP